VAPFAGTIVNGLPPSVCAARLFPAATGNLQWISATLPVLTRALTPFERKKRTANLSLQSS